jgi:hypothetical protein
MSVSSRKAGQLQMMPGCRFVEGYRFPVQSVPVVGRRYLPERPESVAVQAGYAVPMSDQEAAAPTRRVRGRHGPA